MIGMFSIVQAVLLVGLIARIMKKIMYIVRRACGSFGFMEVKGLIDL
jgi:hypothetical protein